MTNFIVFGVFLLIAASVFFFKDKLSDNLILFSEVTGQVFDGEDPLSNIEVERTTKWQDQEFKEIAKSNEKGEFNFKTLEHKVYFNFLFPSEPYIEQKISFHVGNKQVVAWGFTKRNYRNNSELNGRSIQFICDINAEPKRIDGVFGVCKFSN